MQNHLKGRRILVAEDEYYVATELEDDLVACGATVVGPVSFLKLALVAIESGDLPDAAILDANLGGEMVFPVADILLKADIPFLFYTGYDRRALPPRYASVPLLEKPALARHVVQRLSALISPAVHPMS